jgi:hypothetical protein
MTTTTLVNPGTNVTAALLKISGLRMLLPQREIRALEPAESLVQLDAAPHSVGWLQHAQQRWPVYCLAQDLSLLSVVPRERRACVLLSAGAGYVGILCDDVSVSAQSREQRHELPLAMRRPDTPVLALIAVGDEGVVCVTSAEQLAAHVVRLAGG